MKPQNPDLSSHYAAVKEIAIDGVDKNSIRECLEDKVNEITKLKEENLALNTKVKIADEASKLMEAEYAFQRNEYEQEIEMLKQNEENLKKALLKFESRQNFDVDIEFQKKVATLQSNYDKAINQIQVLEKENEAKLSKLQNKNLKLRNAYQELLNTVEKYQKRIDRRNKIIEELSNQLQNQSIHFADKAEQEESLTVQKLKQKLNRQTARLNQVETRNADIEKQLSHCESEFEILNDILNTRIPINEEWIEIRNRIKNLMTNTKVIFTSPISSHESSAKIPILNNNERESHEATPEKQLQTKENEAKFNELKEKYEKLIHFAPQQRIRMQYAKVICKNHYLIVDNVLNLHNAMFNSDLIGLRPIALMAIFLNRWINIKQHSISDSYDDVSLMSLSAIPKLSFIEKFKQINEKFSELTSEIINAKNNLISSQEKIKSLQQQLSQIDSNNEGQRKEFEATKKALHSLRNHLSSLQEELATAIPSEKFEEVLSKSTYNELELEMIKDDSKKLREEIEDKDILIHELSKKIREYEVIKETKEDEIKDIRTISENRCHEIEILKTKLKDKTKELLALERIVYQSNPVVLDPGINNKKAEKEKKEPININPLFLGSAVVK